MAESLLPCPFCGGEAAYEEVEDRASSNSEAIRFSVGCGNEDCIGCQSMTSFSRRIDAITAWNRRDGVETPEKLWYIECNKCGRQDNPGYGCNALQPDGTRCNGTMRRTRLLFESNFGTPPDPRPAVETAASPDIEQAFEAGWRVASRWAERDDLLADIGSAAYHADLTKALKSVSRFAVKAAAEPTPAAPEDDPKTFLRENLP